MFTTKVAEFDSLSNGRCMSPGLSRRNSSFQITKIVVFSKHAKTIKTPGNIRLHIPIVPFTMRRMRHLLLKRVGN